MPYDNLLGLSPDEIQRQLLIEDARKRQMQRDQELQAAMEQANQAPQGASPVGALGALGGNLAGGYMTAKGIDATLGLDSAAQAATQANGALGAATAADAAESVAPSASLASYAIPGAITAIGGYQALKGIKEGDKMRGALGGAASGAGAGWMLGGPVGAGVGAGIGGLTGLLGSALNQHNTRKEQQRWGALQDAGFSPWDPAQLDYKNKSFVPKGQSMRPDLAADFVGENNGWVNNKFSNSRSEKDLTGRDIMGYATFAENLGKPWMDADAATREAIANDALKQGLVREHQGTVDVDFSKGFDKAAKAQLTNAIFDKLRNLKKR